LPLSAPVRVRFQLPEAGVPTKVNALLAEIGLDW
jgi:hypothetical protein